MFWRRKSVIAPAGNLLLLNETVNRKLKVVDLHDYYLNLLDNRDTTKYLGISLSLYNRIIPMIDCDSSNNVKLATSYLNKQHIKYITIESSPEKYWVFPDLTFRTFDDAWKAICYIPGNDFRYLKISRDRKLFVVRGELKDPNYIPNYSISCPNTNPIVARFANKLIEHYNNEQLKIVSSLKTDTDILDYYAQREHAHKMRMQAKKDKWAY